MKELSYPSSMPVPVLSVVVPCHNEQGTIEPLLKEWSAMLESRQIPHELIVINDGSLDGTSRVLDRLRKEVKHLRIVHQLNSGHGKAILRGYEMARGEWILQLDSSGRFEPSDFDEFWKVRDGYDLVVANRTHRLDQFFRRLSIRIVSSLIESFFKIEIPDPDVSFRLFRRTTVLEKVRQLPTVIRGVNLAMTILIKKSSPAKVADLKVPYRLRALHKGRLSVLQTVRLLKSEVGEIVKLRYWFKELWA